MYRNGLKDFSDAIGAHPSGYNVPPSITTTCQTSTSESREAPSDASVRSRLDRCGLDAILRIKNAPDLDLRGNPNQPPYRGKIPGWLSLLSSGLYRRLRNFTGSCAWSTRGLYRRWGMESCLSSPRPEGQA